MTCSDPKDHQYIIERRRLGWHDRWRLASEQPHRAHDMSAARLLMSATTPATNKHATPSQKHSDASKEPKRDEEKIKIAKRRFRG